jgi:uncharacterized membrane protein YfcA
VHFPISGVDVFPLWPLLTALAISFLTSLGGVSGAFLLLPYQVSILGFTSPAVSSTNLLYNVVAIPSGIYRFAREGRMIWPLVWIMVAGNVPGAFLGAWIRLRYLPDPRLFKLFVGLVLLYIGGRLVHDVVQDLRGITRKPEEPPRGTVVSTISVGPTRITYSFGKSTYSFNPVTVFALVVVLGVVGGAYGIGGGAMLAPILVAIFRLPVHTIAGATLASTFATSIVGVVAYIVLTPVLATGSASPDWLLGALLGLGGLLGIYLGASLQKHVPARWIKVLLSAVILCVSIRYIVQYFT